jgi:WD40 repeat protein
MRHDLTARIRSHAECNSYSRFRSSSFRGAMGGVITRQGAIMTATCTRAGFAFFLVLVPASFPLPALGDENSKKDRTDLYGDPLPKGALARLGSMRFRHAGLSDFVLLDGGKTILTAGSDRVLRFWDSASGKQTRTVELQGQSGPGRIVTLSPDGKILAAHDGGNIFLWAVESGKEIKTLPISKVEIGFLHFSPDGKTLAVGRGDWKVSLWDWQIGKERSFPLAVGPRRGFQFNMDSTFHGSFSPDGKWFVAGAQLNEPLGIFDAATGREVRRISCRATTSTVSPDSTRLAVSSDQNAKGESETVVRLFDLASGKETAQFPLGDGHSPSRLTFGPDGKTLACSRSNPSCILDCSTGRVLQRFSTSVQWVPWDVAFSPDGKTLVASAGGRLRFWDISKGKEFHVYPGEFSTPVLAVSPDGRFLASSDYWFDREVSLWDAATGTLVRRLPLGGEKETVRHLAFSPDGQTFVACQHDGFIQFWDLATGKEQRTAQLRDPSHPNRGYAYFYRLFVSPDTQYVATLERIDRPTLSTRLAFWERATGKLLHQHRLPSEVQSGTWLDNGTAVALRLQEGVSVIDLNSGADRFRVPDTMKGGPFTTSPDGRLLAVLQGTSKPHHVAAWETTTGKEAATIMAGRVDHVALAGDNRSLVTTDTQYLHVWDLADGKERLRWPLPLRGEDSLGDSHVFALTLSADGRRAFTVLSDGTCLVWDLTTARPGKSSPQEKVFVGWWTDLASEDARRAYAAVWHLGQFPEQAVTFLQGHLQPAEEADPKKVRLLIADLENEVFETREKAFEALKALGGMAAPAIHRALDGQPSPEARRRLQSLVAQSMGLVTSPEILRGLRAIQVLEHAASPEARELLRKLAAGAAGARLTREAKAALERLPR